MIETAVQTGEQWAEKTGWEDLARAACTAAMKQTPHGGLVDHPVAIEISVKFADNEEVQQLNKSYRGKDRPTNVLSFPMVQKDMLAGLANSDDGEVLLGDIVLAHGICADEAKDKGIAIDAHAMHLIVHGTLHLLGYDHEQGEAEAEAMETLEREALAALGIADPYSSTVSDQEV
ncbi:MAG: rRNA maturation RNase YbeY [Sphingomonadaceae bacterium]|nr:rRNA maturation RNase YbeY [Sphingomonadaceae bacterium]